MLPSRHTRRHMFAAVGGRRATLGTSRRTFLAISFAAFASPASTSDGTPPVIGMLANGSAESSALLVQAFVAGLRERGLIEGRDFSLHVGWAEGDASQFERLAKELVRR